MKISERFTQKDFMEILETSLLSAQETALLAVLFTYSDSYNKTDISYKDIKCRSGIGNSRTVSKAIQKLEAHGIISVKRSGQHEQYKPNQYTLYQF